jgi:hypothetical protein
MTALLESIADRTFAPGTALPTWPGLTLHPGQEIYFRTARPWTLADIVLDNSDPDSPVILSAVSPPGGASARPSATPTVRAPEPQ